jgi:hypothetical protein
MRESELELGGCSELSGLLLVKGCSFIGVASRDIYTDITKGGASLPQLPHESQLLASVAISSLLMQSRFNFVPPAFPLYIEP